MWRNPLNSLGKLRPRSDSSNRRKILSRTFFALSILFVFFAGFLIGGAYLSGKQQLDLNQFWQVYGIIQNRFVGNVDKSKASEGAVKGLVASLGDPFSAYLPPAERKSLDDELKGEFEGIGAELTQKDGVITVVTPLEDSPALAAGLKPNDVVIKIDGSTTEGMTVNEAVNKIRGPKDTKVTLTVYRKRATDPLDIVITRQAITVKSVKYELRAGNIAYISINQFGEDTVDLSKQAVATAVKNNVKAIVIDLRNNPGGYLNDVAPISGLFVPPSTVVIQRYKDGRTDSIKSVDLPIAPTVPLYVLVNDGSASAAEILAGALQDYKRATLIGKKTFGKGSVQDIISLANDSALRLTIAEWLTPNKREVNGKGIEPDIKVTADKTDVLDPVYDAAVGLISKLP